MTGIIIGLHDLPARKGIPLATKEGKDIPNERRLERAPAQRQAAVEIMTKAHPNAKFRSISATYNCVGMVFACRRTCVDPAFVLRILYEDGYRKLKQMNELQVGDVVVYKDGNGEPQHVGTVLRVEPSVADASWRVEVVSKWGADAEYLHEVSDVPVIYGIPEYWTERVTPDEG